MRFRLGAAEVEVADGVTVTRFADGKKIFGEHAEQARGGQRKLAAELGYRSARAMNVHHDLTHTLLSTMLGLPHSLTLRGVADAHIWPHHRIEEQAVLRVQAFALAAGIDLLRVAEAHSRKD